MRNWHVAQVTRPDAGGKLYAPVRIVDNQVIEHGITPSHSEEVMRRVVDWLNNIKEEST